MGCSFSMSGLLYGLGRVFILTLTNNYSIQKELPIDEDDGRCELIGTFSLVTQAFLGLLCLSSLIVKRSYEWPVRRTWPVWFFDVSKQLLGAMGVHVFNVVLAILKTQHDDRASSFDDDGWEDGSEDDPCNWYFLNLMFDCTVGVWIFSIIFHVINRICTRYLHIQNIKSGEYGDPNKPSVTAYLKQLIIYYISLMTTKVVLFFIMGLFATQLLWITAHVLLFWLDNYPEEFEILMVMFVIPIIMNCLQLVLVDNIIQNPYFRIRNKNSEEEEESDISGDTISGDAISNESNHGEIRSRDEEARLDDGPPKTYGTINT